MKQQVIRKEKQARYHFDSLPELARYLDETPATWTASYSRDGYPSHDWDLKAGYEGAWTMARGGWLEGAAKAKAALKKLPAGTPAPKNKIDYVGHRVSMARYIANDPRCMINKVKKKADRAKQSVLSLIVPVNASGDTDADYMTNFGLGIAQYVNQLELSGTKVEVIGAIVSTTGGWRVAHTWNIKRHAQPLDLAVLSFAIGHPAMFRRIGFALRERCPAPNNSSYGNSVAAMPSDCLACPTGAIILNGMRNAQSIARTPEAALAYIREYIENALAGKAQQ